MHDHGEAGPIKQAEWEITELQGPRSGPLPAGPRGRVGEGRRGEAGRPDCIGDAAGTGSPGQTVGDGEPSCVLAGANVHAASEKQEEASELLCVLGGERCGYRAGLSEALERLDEQAGLGTEGDNGDWEMQGAWEARLTAGAEEHEGAQQGAERAGSGMAGCVGRPDGADAEDGEEREEGPGGQEVRQGGPMGIELVARAMGRARLRLTEWDMDGYRCKWAL